MVWVRRSVNLDETRKMNQGFLLNLDNARGLYLSLLKLKGYFFLVIQEEWPLRVN